MMYTTDFTMRRQGRLLTALLDQVEHAVSQRDWSSAEESLAVFGDRLQQRIELAEGSVFPWIERRVEDPQFPPTARLRLQHASLVEGTAATLSAVRQHRHPAALSGLRNLLAAHLAEEDHVLWPLVAVQPRA